MILLCMGRDEDGDAAGLSRITGVTRDEGSHDAERLRYNDFANCSCSAA
jgi:hypothetical protein